MAGTKAASRCRLCRCHLLEQRGVKQPIRVCPMCDLVNLWPQSAEGRWRPVQ